MSATLMSETLRYEAGLCSSSDCRVMFQPSWAGCEVEVHSSVERMFGPAIEALAREMLEAYGVTRGHLLIEDDGALEPVLAARIETVLRVAGFESQSEQRSARTALRFCKVENREPGRKDRVRWARLYLPGNQPNFMINADSFGADMLVFDLEDSVPPDRKLEARILVRNMLCSSILFKKSELAVRINPLRGSCGKEDLEEVLGAKPHAIVLPKTASALDVQQLDEELSRLEGKYGITKGSVLIMPLIETAEGVLAAREIAGASHRNAALLFGYEDFMTDIHARQDAVLDNGLVQSSQLGALLARQMIVLAARVCGIEPLDSVIADISDNEALKRSCAEARQIGMGGKAAIHPMQIPTIRACFAPSEQDIAWARGIVEAYEKSMSEGKGTAVQASSMIDAPVVARARRILQEAENKD